MKSSNGLAMPAVLSLTDAPDIHLLFMAGLVLLTGIAAVGSVVVLLVLAPLAALIVNRLRRLRSVTAVSANRGEQKRPDAGATRLPPSREGGTL